MLWSRDEYKKILNWWVLWRDRCPFCADGELFDKDMLIWEGDFWVIMRNKFPYTGNDKHLLVTPKRHVILSSEITEREWWEFVYIHNFMREFFWENEYFSFTRETYFNESDRSVEHLHMHFVPWSIKWKFIRKMLELQGFPITQELKF